MRLCFSSIPSFHASRRTIRLAERMLGPMLLMLVAACASKGEIVVDDGVGVTAVRTACPAVGIPDDTGDVTLFRPAPAMRPDSAALPPSHDARSIDVVASMTDVSSTCDQAVKLAQHKASAADKRRMEASTLVHTTVTMRVLARRTDTLGPRDVNLPWFITVLRGGTAVVSKRIGTAHLHFNDGEARASTTVSGVAVIDKAEATLNGAVRARITRQRKPGEADAAIDPLDDPEVRAAVRRATFEVLVGFQLDNQQLAYNATR